MIRVGVIGRTRALLETAQKLADHGVHIPFIYTCPAEAFYRCSEEDFKTFAESIGADFFNDLDINSEERVETIKNYHCDVAVSVNWLKILRAPICEAFKHGIWNAHAGDLPRYRGNACPNWAILNNESRVGLTIHEMVPDELDSGDIIAKEYFHLSPEIYIGDIYRWMTERIPEIFLQEIIKLEQGTLQKTPQSRNPNDILRGYPRKPQDAQIIWSNKAEDILKLVRASSTPFSGAFCYLEDGTLVRIWRARALEHHGHFLAVPGQVLYAKEGDPVIACGEGILQLHEVTLDTLEDAKPLILKSLRNRLV